MKDVRKGQAPGKLGRDEFHLRFLQSFRDPAFAAERDALGRLEAIAWDGYQAGRKAPLTQKAGAGFADPDYDLSVEWKANRDRLLELAAVHKDPSTPSRVLLIIGSARNDGTCPGEMSKTFRLAQPKMSPEMWIDDREAFLFRCIEPSSRWTFLVTRQTLEALDEEGTQTLRGVFDSRRARIYAAARLRMSSCDPKQQQNLSAPEIDRAVVEV